MKKRVYIVKKYHKGLGDTFVSFDSLKKSNQEAIKYAKDYGFSLVTQADGTVFGESESDGYSVEVVINDIH